MKLIHLHHRTLQKHRSQVSTGITMHRLRQLLKMTLHHTTYKPGVLNPFPH